jgi:hypothetical protein
LASRKIVRPPREPLARHLAVEERVQARTRLENNASITPGDELLQRLYVIYKTRGPYATTDSEEIARLIAIDSELIEDAARELHKRNLVGFDACDSGLINLRLTIAGIDQMERPPCCLDSGARK